MRVIKKLPIRHNGHVINGVLITYIDFLIQTFDGLKMRMILTKHNGKSMYTTGFFIMPLSPKVPKFFVYGPQDTKHDTSNIKSFNKHL